MGLLGIPENLEPKPELNTPVVERTSESYRKYRPTAFKDVLGQDEAVAMVRTFITENRVPHAILFSGPSGTGKTTLARIMRAKMRCDERCDFFDINAAEQRGIDAIRDIMHIVTIRPMCSPCRIWLIDECFHKNTLIDTIDGTQKISLVKPGTIVYNLRGIGEVEKTFKNHVPLDRLIRLEFSDGRILFTTLEHRFLTRNGWREAKELTSIDVITTNPYKRVKDERDEDLCNLSESVCNTEESSKSGMLFEKMCRNTKGTKEREWNTRRTELSRVWSDFFCKKELEKGAENILQQVLSSKQQTQETRIPREVLQLRSLKEDFRKSKGVWKNRKSYGVKKIVFGQDENLESLSQSCRSSKNKRYKGTEWNLACLGWKERRKWAASRTTEDPVSVFTELINGLETRAIYNDWIWTGERYSEKSYEISAKLQGRYRKSTIENRYRNRWERPQIEKEYIARCQKEKSSREIRLENSQIYEPGNNDELFGSIVSDRERNQGFVEFYDLQVSGNPSYFVDGIPVHNCHALTADAQSCLLKALENTPEHAYFFLATTQANKLKKEIRTRCTSVVLNPLCKLALEGAVTRIAEIEKKDIPPQVLQKLIEVADGSGRHIINDWDRIKSLSSVEEQLKTLQLGIELEQSAFEIWQLLSNKNGKWSEVASIIKHFRDKKGEEPEGLRCLILKSATSYLLGNAEAYAGGMALHILNNFQDSVPWSGITGWANLVRAAYAVFQCHRR